jgi:hypothetical protein
MVDQFKINFNIMNSIMAESRDEAVGRGSPSVNMLYKGVTEEGKAQILKESQTQAAENRKKKKKL